MDHQMALQGIVEWASGDDNVRVVVLTGGGARSMAELNDLSDLDIELYVDRPSELLDESAWYEGFGDVLVVEALPNPGWHPTRLVYYVDGKIDFLVAPTAAVADAEYVRPFRVLLDKDGRVGHLRVKEPSSHRLPSAEEYLECVHWFYAAALMCAKCAVRGELWMAKHRDFDIKTQLLRMIEWDHKARYGAGYDTWFLGGHLHDWMDEDIREAVAPCWGHFDAQDTARGLSETLPLFNKLADRTSRQLGFSPFDHTRAASEVRRILALVE